MDGIEEKKNGKDRQDKIRSCKKKKKNDVTSEGRQKIEVEQMWAIKTNRKQRTT